MLFLYCIISYCIIVPPKNHLFIVRKNAQKKGKDTCNFLQVGLHNLFTNISNQSHSITTQCSAGLLLLLLFFTDFRVQILYMFRHVDYVHNFKQVVIVDCRLLMCSAITNKIHQMAVSAYMKFLLKRSLMQETLSKRHFVVQLAWNLVTNK